MSFFPIIAPSGTKVTLSGEPVSAVMINATAQAAIRIDDYGNMYLQKNFGSYAQVDTATDWVRPASKAPGLYECRYTNHSGDPVSATKAEDTWHTLSTSEFIVSISMTAEGTKSASFTLQIRLNGGPVLASGSYSLTATYIFDPGE